MLLDVYERVYRFFGLGGWIGELEDVKIDLEKGVALVVYEHRGKAEFVKEVMSN